MDLLQTVVDFLNGYIWAWPSFMPALVMLLLGTGVFMTARLGLIQLRRLKHAVDVVRGLYDKPGDHGDISHFAALSTALSATVGIGNIAGVATAIHYGGPGALFWMWVTAFLGMALKYSEVTLALHYRDFDEEGRVAGGPMHYMVKGLGPKWKPLAVLFAFAGIVASFGGGNMNQANTIAVSASSELGLGAVGVGAFCAIVVGVVILGGIQRIASVSSKLAPIMAVIYVAGALGVLAFNLGELPGAFATIVADAFNPKASVGGSVAGTFAVTMLWGVKRGLFSNESGQGSAPIAHAATRTDEPVSEGAVALLEPLIDTLIICTMTGLAIVATGVWDKKFDHSLPLAHAQAVLATEVEGAGGQSERAKLSAALEGRAAASDVAVEVPVSAGRQSVVAFVAQDGLVEAPVLQNADGSPFSGVVSFVPRDGAFRGTVPPTLSGRMLLNSSALTARAFKDGLAPLGGWGSYVVTLSVFLFAISTMISWSYYGDRCVTYLFGRRGVLPYRVVYTVFVFVGANSALELVWAYGDLALGLMAIPNLIALIALSPKVVELTRDYFARVVDAPRG